MGGLCRTCEIFGASKLLLNDLRLTKDHTFKRLAVSSDQWMTMEEVKEDDVSAYLDRLKAEEGYTVVGLEQTSNSVSLTEFTFPQRTLLLLGNERAGLPTHLIRQLDICVEIPQCGLTRSLNVHVSGALSIYEYAKQHVFGDKK